MKHKKPSPAAVRAEIAKLVDISLQTFRKMEDCGSFVGIMDAKYPEDPVTLLQFAAAMMLDKPIYLLLPTGQHIPANVRLVACAIETFEPGNQASFEAGMTKLMAKVQTGTA